MRDFVNCKKTVCRNPSHTLLILNTFPTSAAPATGQNFLLRAELWVSPRRMWGIRLLNFINIARDKSHTVIYALRVLGIKYLDK